MIPLVTVIIPAYNAEGYIEATIKSVLNQTWQNIEIVIVDDGSTDSTYKIAKLYESKIIKVFKQNNKGAASARNYGLRKASGSFIQFLDADDLLSSNKIKDQLNDIQKKDNSVAICSTIHFNNDEDHLASTPDAYEQNFLSYSSNPINFFINLWGGYSGQGSMVQPNAWLIPKNLIEKYGMWNEQLSLDDDGEFFARVVLKSSEIIYTKNAFNYYRKFKYKGSLSSSDDEKAYSSLLNSAISKQKELLSMNCSIYAKIAIYRLFTDIAFNTYMRYPKIYRCSIKQRPNIRYPYPLFIETSIVTKILSFAFGWKFVKALQIFMK